jgi:hypothetical protein
VETTTSSKDESFGVSNLRLLKGNDNGNFMFVEVHVVKSCNDLV